MQSTEGKGQRDWIRIAAETLSRKLPNPESELGRVQAIMKIIADAYSQSGAGPNVCRVSPVEAQEILANPTATKEQIEWAHQQTRTLSGAGSPEETGTCLVCPCGKAYRIIGGEIVELSKEQAEVMQEEAASSSQSGENAQRVEPTMNPKDCNCEHVHASDATCPTCKSKRKPWRNNPTNANRPECWENTEGGTYVCVDPWHLEPCAPEPPSLNSATQSPKASALFPSALLPAGGGSTGEREEPGEWIREIAAYCVTGDADGTTCPICAWTLKEDGCTLESCAFRPDDSARQVNLQRRRETFQAAIKFISARAALAEGSRTRHCAICAENRPATCDGRCELVAPVKGAEGETNGRHGL